MYKVLPIWNNLQAQDKFEVVISDIFTILNIVAILDKVALMMETSLSQMDIDEGKFSSTPQPR